MQTRTEAVLKNTGFTIIELMVAMVISLLVMGAIYSTFQVQQKSYIHQERVAAVQQNLRAAMYYMTREIRMAGYDPSGDADAKIVTAATIGDTTNTINFTMDYTPPPDPLPSPYRPCDPPQPYNECNGVIDSGENIDYRLGASFDPPKPRTKDLFRTINTPLGSKSTVIAENIKTLEFTYLDQNSNGTIETIHIKIVGENQKDTTISRTLESNIKCRNIDI